MSKPLLLIIDGHSLAYRCYHAYGKSQEGGLTTSDGVPINICFGFIKALTNAINYHNPHSLIIAFDTKQPTFRHILCPNYKSQRKETPQDFIADITNLYRIVEAAGIPIARVAGYEADDVIGTVAVTGSRSGYQVKILSGDKDMFQLVDDANQISILYQSTDIKEVTESIVLDKIGVRANQIIDYKSLYGDTSDSIKGVRGIGHIIAVKLLTEHHSLDNIFNSIDKLTHAVKSKLVSGKEDAYKSQYLATIVTNVPIEIDWDKAKLKPFDLMVMHNLLKELQIDKLAVDLQTAIVGTCYDEVLG